MSKLPFKLRERWRSIAYDILETSKCRALFKDLVAFIEKHVRILSDPLLGDIRDLPSGTTGSKVVSKLKSQPGNRIKGNSFATTIAPVQSIENSRDLRVVLPAQGSTVRSTCICCSRSHSSEECQHFKRKKHREKIHFLQQQRLDDDGLRTVMCKAEAILNVWPITKLSDDPKDLEPLTPNHILLMKGRPALPPGLFESHDLYVK